MYCIVGDLSVEVILVFFAIILDVFKYWKYILLILETYVVNKYWLLFFCWNNRFY